MQAFWHAAKLAAVEAEPNQPTLAEGFLNSRKLAKAPLRVFVSEIQTLYLENTTRGGLNGGRSERSTVGLMLRVPVRKLEAARHEDSFLSVRHKVRSRLQDALQDQPAVGHRARLQGYLQWQAVADVGPEQKPRTEAGAIGILAFEQNGRPKESGGFASMDAAG